ncbi:ubiquitin carboxyl-terminal hydrolase 10-like [Limulus polyphemus]|uniref:ubiquitinyl hydrolase 1 n=1 Tax=Limulus polyphemus TaxID=6850 RepID=A0ABM1BB04_LIMPO|nr:ubiquitin carboxyl-terminal hydrolase 10-like [Limulus polyphemus]
MEFQDLEFLDLSNIPENEAKQIHLLLHPPDGTYNVELPWVKHATTISPREIHSSVQLQKIKDHNIDEATLPTIAPLNPPPAVLSNPPVVPPHFVSSSGATALPHLAGSQAFPFIPRSYPLLPHRFPHSSPSVFTGSVSQQEVTVVHQSSLPPAFPSHATNREYISVSNEDSENIINVQKKGDVTANNQVLQNDKKNSSDYCSSVDEAKTQRSGHQGINKEESLPTGIPSVVPVPFTVPPNSFPVTTGTIPVAAAATRYPPGIAPVHYQPQGPSAPVLYAVPFISSAYPGFIHPQTSPVISEHHGQEDGHTSDKNGARMSSTVQSVAGEHHELYVTPTCNSNDSKLTMTCVTYSQQSQTNTYQTIHSGEVQKSQIIPEFKLEFSSDSNNEVQKTSSATMIPENSNANEMISKQPFLYKQTSNDEYLCSGHPHITPVDKDNSSEKHSESSDVSSDCLVTGAQTKIPIIVKRDCSSSEPVLSPTQVDTNSDLAGKVKNTNVWQRRSGADLFKDQHLSQTLPQESDKISFPTVSSTKVPEIVENEELEDGKEYKIVKAEEDLLAVKLVKIFENTQLNHTTLFLQPRGLINQSNWCYINATLQALLVCPPFYNLLNKLTGVLGQNRTKSSTPILDSLVEFMQEFPTVPLVGRNKRKEDLAIGTSFEPGNVYKMLNVIKSECVKGRQEDAEEFLSCILNGLHEEMLAILKTVRRHEENPAWKEELAANGHLDDNGEEGWQVMGPKNKSIVTRSASFSRSPISDIFGGQMRSVLTAGNESSAFLQPFFTLQLDIQSEQVDSVLAALEHLTSKEPVQGYTCAKTKQEVEASRRITLEELPLVLVLHFKRFVYDKDGGSKKVVKCTEYSVTLELSRDLLSQEVRSKYSHKSLRSYKLFAVVYHEGKEAVKGHYITDVYHAGSGGWLRCDDRTITPITETQLLRYSPPRVPYLLFYRRLDTIQPGVLLK